MVKKERDKIVIFDKEFNIDEILNCGQVFSFCKLNANTYRVVSCDKVAIVSFDCKKTEIITKDVDYFYNYFDLDTDYKKINGEIIKLDNRYKNYIKTNLHILRQDAYQTIISFIVSANNNIKRITKILDKICNKFGSYIKEYDCYSFPTIKQLENASIEDFISLGCGYRANYLVETIKKLKTSQFDIKRLKNLSSKELKEQLLLLNGVGPKVADCILFFGFSSINAPIFVFDI